MRRLPLVLALTVVTALSSTACGDDGDAGTPSTTTTAPTSTSTTTGESTSTSGVTTTAQVAEPQQPAIWPAAGTTFATPEAAAEDFVSKALGVPPVLGDFRQGDSRSGEIDVLFTGEAGSASTTRIVRSTLDLRQLGPDDGWFVLGARNDKVSIASPSASSTVPAGPLTVAGVARGFEANVVVVAMPAGRADAEIDREVTQGGSYETPEPYTVGVDLTGTQPGEIVTLLVKGGVGAESDPGEFSAIPVVIG